MKYRKTAGVPVNENGNRGKVVELSQNRDAQRQRRYRMKSANGEPVKVSFLSWDGEGITHPGMDQQSYCLFGCTPEDYIMGYSLSTLEIFDFIIEMGQKYGRNVIHVAFAFTYDVNMMLKDLPLAALERIAKSEPTWYKEYRIEWIPRKWFRLTKKWEDENGKKHKVSVTIYDVFTFFAQSFVKVCHKYLSDEDISLVEAGKPLRDNLDSWRWENLESLILPYWKQEITLIAKVMERYREILYSVGIYITKWYGPGAVATFELQKHGITDHLTQDIPEEVLKASAHAYAGGRFELFKVGHYDGKVWGYDINSAYPNALTKVRSIAPEYGEWVHRTEIDRTQPISENMAVYRIAYSDTSGWEKVSWFEVARGRKPECTDPRWAERIQPLFHRDKSGNISFPRITEGWYWDPEASLVWDNPDAEFFECWEFVPTEVVYPFMYIKDNFARRLQLKAEGNPAELGLKLGMNSMYGKLAQRIGWDEVKFTPPRWHQLEYAGWLTSYTRAMIFKLAKIADDNDALIACETDGIYTTIPLDEFCDVGKELGQWDESFHEGITYVQSGFYWKKSWDKDRKDYVWYAKYRGLDPESVTHDKMLAFMKDVGGKECPGCEDEENETLFRRNHRCEYVARTRRFRGIGIALMSKDKLKTWRIWEESDKKFHPGWGEGKREHHFKTCSSCRAGMNFTDGMHPMQITRPGTDGMSFPHNLPWKTGKLTEGQEMVDKETAHLTITGREEDGVF